MHARLDDMKRTLGEFVKQRRAEMKLSQRELAKLSGLSNTYIASLELDANPATGKSISPTMPTLEKLAKGLRVDAEVLIRIARGEPLEAKKGPPTEEEFLVLVEKYKALPIEMKKQAIAYLEFLNEQDRKAQEGK